MESVVARESVVAVAVVCDGCEVSSLSVAESGKKKHC